MDRVCLYVREHNSGTTRPIFANFLCKLPPMAVARSFLAALPMNCYYLTSKLDVAMRFVLYGRRHICAAHNGPFGGIRYRYRVG